MTRVVVTGAAGRLGSRVVRLLAGRDDAPEVVGVDLLPSNPGGPSHRLDLATADLADAFAGADAVLHLASVFGAGLEGPEIDTAVEVALARRVLEAADHAGVGHVVVMSSATVFVQAVVSIDGKKVADGKAGPMTDRLREIYVDFARKTAV